MKILSKLLSKTHHKASKCSFVKTQFVKNFYHGFSILSVPSSIYKMVDVYKYILDMLQYLSTSTQVVRVEIRRDTCCRWLVRPVASTADSCKTSHHTAVVVSSPASLLLALLSATLPGLSHIVLLYLINMWTFRE